MTQKIESFWDAKQHVEQRTMLLLTAQYLDEIMYI